MPEAKQTKTLYHGELRQLGPVQVTVKKEWTESTKKKGTYYTTLVVNGVERYYNPENQQCLEFWAGKAGQTITVVAAGSREEATLVQMQTVAQVDQPTAPAPAPSAAPRPPQAVPAAAPSPRPGVSNAPTAQPPRASAPSSAPVPSRPTGDSHQNGQRVGMAINQAVQFLCHSGEGWDPKLIYERASDLVRLAQQLEAGHLAPKFSERHPAAAAAPSPEDDGR